MKNNFLDKDKINQYWEDLTVVLDNRKFDKAFNDPFVDKSSQRIYVEDTDQYAIDFYKRISEEAENKFEVGVIPNNPKPEFVKSIEDKPGIVSSVLTVTDHTAGTPYVSLGGNHTELDTAASYFNVKALIKQGDVARAKQILGNITYMIGHVNSLKATNRSYHLAVPALPLYSSMARSIAKTIESEDEKRMYLKSYIMRSILEYNRTWNQDNSLSLETGLNRYPKIDVDPKTLTFDITGESVLPVRLNMMLYKTEKDIAHFIEKHIAENSLEIEGVSYTPEFWRQKANARIAAMNKYFWNEEKGTYSDYDEATNSSVNTHNADFIYAFWAKAANTDQYKKIISSKVFKDSMKDNGFQYNANSPEIQAPEQIILWEGLENYGAMGEAKSAAANWNEMLKNQYQQNGSLPLKFNVESGKSVDEQDKNVYAWTLSSYILAL